MKKAAKLYFKNNSDTVQVKLTLCSVKEDFCQQFLDVLVWQIETQCTEELI